MTIEAKVKCWTYTELEALERLYEEHRKRLGIGSNFQSRDFLRWIAPRG